MHGRIFGRKSQHRKQKPYYTADFVEPTHKLTLNYGFKEGRRLCKILNSFAFLFFQLAAVLCPLSTYSVAYRHALHLRDGYGTVTT